MVEDTGKTLRTGAYRPVNLPAPVQVQEDAVNLPRTIKEKRRQTIERIEDQWRLDDEWWRGEPVSRLYYSVLLASGQRLILYKDLNDARWYRQSY